MWVPCLHSFFPWFHCVGWMCSDESCQGESSGWLALADFDQAAPTVPRLCQLLSLFYSGLSSVAALTALTSRSFAFSWTPAECNNDVCNTELLAVKLALEEWKHWLEGAILDWVTPLLSCADVSGSLPWGRQRNPLLLPAPTVHRVKPPSFTPCPTSSLVSYFTGLYDWSTTTILTIVDQFCVYFVVGHKNCPLPRRLLRFLSKHIFYLHGLIQGNVSVPKFTSHFSKSSSLLGCSACLFFFRLPQSDKHSDKAGQPRLT